MLSFIIVAVIAAGVFWWAMRYFRREDKRFRTVVASAVLTVIVSFIVWVILSSLSSKGIGVGKPYDRLVDTKTYSDIISAPVSVDEGSLDVVVADADGKTVIETCDADRTTVLTGDEARVIVETFERTYPEALFYYDRSDTVRSCVITTKERW